DPRGHAVDDHPTRRGLRGMHHGMRRGPRVTYDHTSRGLWGDLGYLGYLMRLGRMGHGAADDGAGAGRADRDLAAKLGVRRAVGADPGRERQEGEDGEEAGEASEAERSGEERE